MATTINPMNRVAVSRQKPPGARGPPRTISTMTIHMTAVATTAGLPNAATHPLFADRQPCRPLRFIRFQGSNCIRSMVKRPRGIDKPPSGQDALPITSGSATPRACPAAGGARSSTATRPSTAAATSATSPPTSLPRPAAFKAACPPLACWCFRGSEWDWLPAAPSSSSHASASPPPELQPLAAI